MNKSLYPTSHLHILKLKRAPNRTSRQVKTAVEGEETMRSTIVFFHARSDQSQAAIRCHVLSLLPSDCAVIFDLDRGGPCGSSSDAPAVFLLARIASQDVVSFVPAQLFAQGYAYRDATPAELDKNIARGR